MSSDAGLWVLRGTAACAVAGHPLVQRKAAGGVCQRLVLLGPGGRREYQLLGYHPIWLAPVTKNDHDSLINQVSPHLARPGDKE